MRLLFYEHFLFKKKTKKKHQSTLLFIPATKLHIIAIASFSGAFLFRVTITLISKSFIIIFVGFLSRIFSPDRDDF
jgi:hypothetical protein